MTVLPLVAAAADLVAVGAHGVVGHRWLRRQLAVVSLPTSALFGDADVGGRVLWVTWHAVTAMFAVSAAALTWVALTNPLTAGDLLLFIATLHGSMLVIGAVALARRLDAVLRPIPPVFVTCMTTVTVVCLLAR